MSYSMTTSNNHDGREKDMDENMKKKYHDSIKVQELVSDLTNAFHLDGDEDDTKQQRDSKCSLFTWVRHKLTHIFDISNKSAPLN